MKNKLLIVLSALSIVCSCKKETEDKITYPASVLYGQNILSFPDGTLLSSSTDYEIGAVLEKDANLSVVITNYPIVDSATLHETEWFYTDNSGWTISEFDYSTQTQKFTSAQTGNISSMILFESYGDTGSCKIDIYENGSTITSTKHFTWH